MNEQTMIPTSTRSNLRGLIVLNAVLLIVLAAVTLGSRVQAQTRGRGEYTMVAGGVNGANAAVAYIVDVANQEMIAVTYNQNTKLLEGIGYRNLAADAAGMAAAQNHPIK
jgi:hypothetical protein